MGRVVGRASEKPYQAAMSHLEGMVRAVAKKAKPIDEIGVQISYPCQG